jgi:hypothetical protein
LLGFNFLLVDRVESTSGHGAARVPSWQGCVAEQAASEDGHVEGAVIDLLRVH